MIQRRKAIERRTRPRRDPEKTRAWQRESQQRAIDRAREQARARPRGRTTKRKARIPREVRLRVFLRSGGECVRPGCRKRARVVHHVLEEQHFPELALCEDNMVGACWDCHELHHRAMPRLPLQALPSCALALAQRLGGRAEVFLERTYPDGEPSRAEPGDQTRGEPPDG